LSIGAGIQWREDIGGEERIMDYCHSLAVEYVFMPEMERGADK
jgi:hypothetical protein